MTIFLMHGVVDTWSAERQTHRNYVGIGEFETYLQSRQTPFADLDASSSSNDILTVDDSTVAGAQACFLARRCGHEVTFFVNPLQVVLAQPYFFSILDHVIDRRSVSHIHFMNRDFKLSDKPSEKQFRLAVKEALMDLPHAQAHQQLQRITQPLKSDDLELPPHLSPVSIDTLRALRDAGVRIENHGWDHNSIRAMNKTQFETHVNFSKAWLDRELGIRSNHYSIPFGLPDVTPEQKPIVADRCFAAWQALGSPLTPVGSFNRVDVTAEIRRFQ